VIRRQKKPGRSRVTKTADLQKRLNQMAKRLKALEERHELVLG